MTDTLSPQNAALKAKFGDIVENGWASEANPTRVGYFVRGGNRKRRMNGGKFWEITDGKGKFWELTPTGEHKITVTPVARIQLPKPAPSAEGVESFQARVRPWLEACFGWKIAGDKLERSDRFIEEALELVQAIGYSADRAHALVDYVFGRPAGDPSQEVGGVMVTLAGLCLASDLDMEAAGETELARVWTKVDVIRAKQAAKPTGSALPIALPAQSVSGEQFAENAKCSVPAGWQLVPEEPTEAMIRAPDDAGVGLYSRKVFATIYRAMLAAAPPSPGPETGVEG